MKEMEYTGKMAVDVLGQGEIDGYGWAIISHGTHPCAYVSPPEEHPAAKMYRNFRWTSLDLTTKVHGGITYAKFGLLDVDPKGKRFWLGWDYAHHGDYVDYGVLPPWPGKKWTTKEIFAQVEESIRELKKVKELDKWND